jgi:hypothetical protein
MVDTAEHAVDGAGLLNWCGVRELDPVPDLVPPDKVPADKVPADKVPADKVPAE